MYEIPAARRIDWSQAGVWNGSSKGIPYYPVGINLTGLTSYGGSALDPTGAADSSSAIRAALAACPNGYAVLLPAGTFRVASAISWSTSKRVVLRGAGPTSTFIKSYSSNSADVFAMSGSSSSGSTAITGGLVHNSYTITVSSASGFVAGDFVRWSEENDPAVVFDVGSWMTRTIGQVNQIASVNGNNITLVRPVYYTYNLSRSPTLSKWTPCQLSGVEDLSIEKAVAGTAAGCVNMSRAANCWVKNVEINKCDYNHIRLFGSFRCEVRDSYLHHGYNYGSGRTYAVWPTEHTCDCLVENNIIYYVRHHVEFEYGCHGNVIAYNYANRMFSDDYPDTDYLTEGIGNHGGYPMFNLIEGNYNSHIVLDDTWGGCLYFTLLRNHSTRYSERVSGGNMLYNLNALEIQQYNYYTNVLGNVFCLPGDTGIYKTVRYDVRAVLRLGNKGATDTTADPVVESTAIFHGNYDYPLNETVWDSSIESHELPASLYLSSKPSWFGSLPWPSIGPDVSGYTQTFPAKWRWDNYVAGGSSNPALLFQESPSTGGHILSTHGSIHIVYSPGLNLGVGAKPSFNISALPTSRVVAQRTTTTYLISATPISGFNGTIRLTASGSPAGSTALFGGSASTIIAANGSATLTVVTDNMTAPVGEYTITIQGDEV